MPAGYLGIVLHAHLPYVRHIEHERSLEERWLFEAIIECYVPLLDAFDRLAEEGIPFAVTMSLTPPLLAMLTDDALKMRFSEHLARIQALAEKEKERLYGSAEYAPIACFYADELARVRGVWDRNQGDLVRAFVRHHDAGRLELITSSATHAYLPGLLPVKERITTQLELGVRAFQMMTGRTPTGAWLPECAYHPGFDEVIAKAGIRFTIVDTHGITLARPQPPFGANAPIVSPSGTAFFARDRESSEQVWSRTNGYPGDAFYRDFYRDIGFDLPEEQLHGETAGDGIRLMTGIKYHRITGTTDDKAPYQPGIARGKAFDHARHFVDARIAQVRPLESRMPSPILVAPYDAELFGHWWFEGPIFLEAVFRELAKRRDELEPITLRHYLERHAVMARATPHASSWGASGYGEVWVGPPVAWMWRHVHHAGRYVQHLSKQADSFAPENRRALRQMAREQLLLESSDWAFIVTTGSSVRYAESRFRAHVSALRHLGHLVTKGKLTEDDLTWLSELEERHRFFHFMDDRMLRSSLD